MTHTTEQERPKREDFEQWSISTNQGYDLTRNQTGCMRTYEQDKTEHAWRGFFHGWLQVARWAQVVPDAYLVYAKGSTRYWVVTLNPDDVPEIYKGGETVPLYRKSAAPQPPEADHIPDAGKMGVAPVQLPEPDAWRYTEARGHYRYRGARPGFAVEYPLLKPEALYTEQQVRQILAAHGIK